jgi:hypothetical protein
MFGRYRFQNVKNPKMCPPQGKRATKSDDYVESEYLGGMTLDYDIQMHFVVAHMRSADGALTPHAGSGQAPEGSC